MPARWNGRPPRSPAFADPIWTAAEPAEAPERRRVMGRTGRSPISKRARWGWGAIVALGVMSVVIAHPPGEVVVARGTADRRYRFSVDVTVPAGIEPGDALMWARWEDDGYSGATTVLLLSVSDAAPA